jgi:SAM-dependent methyltransferase
MQGQLDAWLDTLAGGDDEFVDRAWRLVIRRAPDEPARAAALAKLRDGTLSRAGLLRQLVGSEEFERVAALDDGLAFAAAERSKPRPVAGPARPRGLRAPPGSDERAIELPWCLARYDGERRVLDVGYAFAEPAYLAALTALGAEELVGVDLADAEVPGLRRVAADVRSLPFDDDAFDLALCISTLEHVGRDNDVYAVDAPRDDAGDEAALRELRRVASRLIVSVPTGIAEDHGWQVVRPPLEWIAVFERAGFLVFEDELYARDASGWRSASLADAERARYEGPGAGAVLLAELHPSTFGGKLRLAVRDVRHRGDPRRATVSE